MRPLSFSSIQTFTECPQRWYYKYVEDRKEKPRHFFSFGKTLHAALEFFHDVPAPPPPDLEAVLAKYKESWIGGAEGGWESLDQEETYRKKGEKIIRDYIGKHLDAFKPPRAVEFEFLLDVDGVPVKGYVDRIDDLPGGGVGILDYKTGKELAKDRVDKDEQLTMYQMACEEKLGVRVERLSFYHLDPVKQTEYSAGRRSEEAVRALRRKIVDTAGRIEDLKRQLESGRELQRLKLELVRLEEELRAKAAHGGRRKLQLASLTPEELKAQIAAREGEPSILHFPTDGYPEKCRWCDFQQGCPAWGGHPTVDSGTAEPVEGDKALERKIDEYGKLKEKIHELETEAEQVHDVIVASLRHRGLEKFEGKHFTASMHGEAKWEFTKSSREKAKQEIRSAGRWEQILAPTWSKVQELMQDTSLPLELRDRLQRLGVRVMHFTLRLSKPEEAE